MFFPAELFQITSVLSHEAHLGGWFEFTSAVRQTPRLFKETFLLCSKYGLWIDDRVSCDHIQALLRRMMEEGVSTFVNVKSNYNMLIYKLKEKHFKRKKQKHDCQWWSNYNWFSYSWED